ncbi:MAG: hypothetical protein FWD02_05850 [Bacteroidales bacterium]|nr:hypothetical protein [Bacteroidales bacterium]
MRKIILTGFILAVITTKTFAVRPFITDDAAVIGHRQFQLETWTLFDRDASEHWIMWAYGPIENLEVAIGALWGRDRVNRELSFAVPLLEAKYLFRPYQSGRGPGIAASAGTFLPWGRGDFREDYFGAYGIFMLTQAFGRDESILIHGNLGVNFLDTERRRDRFIPFWGLGTQIRTFGGLHLVGEVISGDPYVPGTGLAYHVGLRHFVSDYFQLDLTFGDGIRGREQMPFWFGFGVRLVLDPARNRSR